MRKKLDTLWDPSFASAPVCVSIRPSISPQGLLKPCWVHRDILRKCAKVFEAVQVNWLDAHTHIFISNWLSGAVTLPSVGPAWQLFWVLQTCQPLSQLFCSNALIPPECTVPCTPLMSCHGYALKSDGIPVESWPKGFWWVERRALNVLRALMEIFIL